MFGEKLAKLRNSRHWTQEDLAKKLNLSRSTIAGYESKGRVPKDTLLIAIANLFNVSLDELMDRGNEHDHADNHPSRIISLEPGGHVHADEQEWKTLAQSLTEVMKMQAENDRLRIEKVDAKAQENLQRILDRLEKLEATAGREDKSDARKSIING